MHTPPDFLVIATLVNRCLGARIILDIHDPMPEFYLSRFAKTRDSWGFRLLKWQEKLSARYSHQVITVTEEWRKSLIGRGLPPEKVSVVMNLPDSEVFKIQKVSPTASRFTVFYHGSLQRRYGVDLLIRAIGEVQRQAPGVHLIIHGKGGYLPEFRGLAAELNLEEHVTFDTNMVETSELPGIICSADVAVVPYRDDPLTPEILPTKLMEYAILGIPVVAARTKVIPLYFDETMVEFFQPGSVEELVDRLLELVRNRRRREELGREIRQFSRRYDWREAQRRYVRLVEEIGRH